MATPNFDALSVQHSRNIGDKVAAATTDGTATSSLQRSTHLNNAIRKWHADMLAIGNKNALSGYIVESPGVSLANNVISLSSASFTGGEVASVISVITQPVA